MNKKQARDKKHRQLEPYKKNGNYSLPGQPQPLTASFESLRFRALQTPMLDAEFSVENINIERHAKIVDFSSSFILAIVVICFLRKRQFFWYVQAGFTSKATAKTVSLNLLTPKQRDAIKKSQFLVFDQIGEVADMEKRKAADCYIWECPFSKADYEKLNPAFLELTDFNV